MDIRESFHYCGYSSPLSFPGHINSRNLSNIGRQERAQRLKRRLYKVSQHISAILDLIKKAKRFLPIPYRWVTDTITETGEGVLH